MPRRTFFSFHYKPDVTRAWVVPNSWVTKVAQGTRDDAGFFDSSVFEASQRESDDSLKRFLREGLKNTTVTCVLVGAETCLRRWVRYEIFQSFVRGNGLLAVQIHTIGALNTPNSGDAEDDHDLARSGDLPASALPQRRERGIAGAGRREPGPRRRFSNRGAWRRTVTAGCSRRW